VSFISISDSHCVQIKVTMSSNILEDGEIVSSGSSLEEGEIIEYDNNIYVGTSDDDVIILPGVCTIDDIENDGACNTDEATQDEFGSVYDGDVDSDGGESILAQYGGDDDEIIEIEDDDDDADVLLSDSPLSPLLPTVTTSADRFFPTSPEWNTDDLVWDYYDDSLLTVSPIVGATITRMDLENSAGRLEDKYNVDVINGDTDSISPLVSPNLKKTLTVVNSTETPDQNTAAVTLKGGDRRRSERKRYIRQLGSMWTK